MADLPNISDSEWEVMKVIWSTNPITAKQIIEQLEDKTDWHPKTVRTLLNRLVNKEVINFDSDKRVYHYYPLVPQEKYLQEKNKSFLQKVYDGALNAMLARFLEQQDLDQEEIEELESILEEKKN